SAVGVVETAAPSGSLAEGMQPSGSLYCTDLLPAIIVGALFTIVTLAAFAVPSSLPSFGVTVTVTVSPLAGLMLVGKPVPVQLLAVCELPSVSESEWLAPSAANASVVDCT